MPYRTLYKTYELFNKHNKVGDYSSGKSPLAPIFHSIKPCSAGKSTIKKFVLDVNGNLIDLVGVSEPVIYPISIKSGCRSSGIAPHGLSEDYKNLSDTNKFEKYKEQLNEWQNFDSENIKLKSICAFINNYETLKEVISEYFPFTDLSDSEKEKKREELFFTFSVLNSEIEDVYRDSELYNSWINFMQNKIASSGDYFIGTDVISGKEDYIVDSFLKVYNVSIFGSSSNNDTNYKRGLHDNFLINTPLSYQTSSKIINMLSYLIRNNSFSIGQHMFIVWSPVEQYVKLRPLCVGTLFDECENGIIDEYVWEEQLKNLYSSGTHMEFDYDIFILEITNISNYRYTFTNFTKLRHTEYINNIVNWEKNLSIKTPNNKIIPLRFDTILKLTFGYEENGKITWNKDRYNGEKIDLIRRRLFGKKLPTRLADKMLLNFYTASHRFSHGTNSKKIEDVALTVIKYSESSLIKNFISTEGCLMNSMSYELGKLLAVLEKVEESATYYKTGKSLNRPTNASKYRDSFIKNYKIYLPVLESKVKPYWDTLFKIKPSWYHYLNNLYNEIIAKISKFVQSNETKINGFEIILGRSDMLNNFNNKVSETGKTEVEN